MQVRRGSERAVSHGPGTVLRHAFSAGPHYDAANTGLGPLVVHDEVELDAGAGFDPHRHRGEEVVTVVLAGELRHEDAAGHVAQVRPGQVAHLSAGAGVEHAEHAGDRPVRFVQARLLSGDAHPPTYAVHALPAPGQGLQHALDVGPGRLLTGGAPALLPAAPHVHLHVLSGVAVLAGQPLTAGDAARLTGEGPLPVGGDAALLVWLLDPQPG